MNYYQYYGIGGGSGGDVRITASIATVWVTSSQSAPVWVTGVVHVDNPGGGSATAVTQGGPWETLVSGTVTVTASTMAPASVAIIGTPTVTANQGGSWTVASISSIVGVSQSNIPVGTASVSVSNFPTVTSVTSTIANPVNVTGSVFVVNSQGSDVRITGTTISIPVTSSLAAPVWVTGTTTVTGTFAAVFSGTQIVTSSIAAPVWVTGTISAAPALQTATTITQVALSITGALLLPSNANRKGAIIFNNTSQLMYVALSTTASLSHFTTILGSRMMYELPFSYQLAVWGIWDAAGAGSAFITEIT